MPGSTYFSEPVGSRERSKPSIITENVTAESYFSSAANLAMLMTEYFNFLGSLENHGLTAGLLKLRPMG